MAKSKLPKSIQAIEDQRYVVWANDEGPDPEFRAHFDGARIPVGGTRHIRVWGMQFDDEYQLPDHGHSTLPEKFWQIELIARDGSRHEVNASLVRAPFE